MHLMISSWNKNYQMKQQIKTLKGHQINLDLLINQMGNQSEGRCLNWFVFIGERHNACQICIFELLLFTLVLHEICGLGACWAQWLLSIKTEPFPNTESHFNVNTGSKSDCTAASCNSSSVGLKCASRYSSQKYRKPTIRHLKTKHRKYIIHHLVFL